MEEEPEKSPMGVDLMEADREEAMGMEAEVEEAKEELQGMEEALRVRIQHTQLSSVPSADSTMRGEDVIGLTHAAEFTNVAGR